ncbi:MAG: class I SAM-dependent methyltransferase [Actinomycetota bacterium]|nr:class I SAM-dependent methyltransferase [Actinomycetota bacterium]
MNDTADSNDTNDTNDTADLEERAGLRDRMFAAMWAKLGPMADEMLDAPKREVLRDLPPRIVEIGPGRGDNFGRYPEGTQVVAFEPNHAMHAGLADAADRHGIDLDLRDGHAEAMDLPDGGEAVVVSTIVLCSVGDPHAAAAEVHRVLRPGGRFAFVEHVAAPPGTMRRRVQGLVRRPWRFVGDGCDLTNDAVAAVHAAGFTTVDATVRRIGSGADLANPTFWGVATR